ncbi:vWA domain-containing protein [Priestia koreensis]|uniref:vWA domain-containing protein n=1 Tax=Priestia koreensis TaxID=284581 RepID=UPI001F57AFD0|nr:VWA domain-containing protein [Priestia koreensis]MCM3005323.1 VWA domain-containing protein [Priestia koreensis]UNL86537.1 VWA domain-containing protein [Priestia koreensis]
MKFIKFNDKNVDSFLFMELADLTKTLTKDEEMEIEYRVSSYYDPLQKKIYLSHFWDNRPRTDMVNGLKSDVFLRSIGTAKHTDFQAVHTFVTSIRKMENRSFAKQLFMLLEDIRLEELCKHERPGTKKAFGTRRAVYRKYFESQMNVNLVKGVYTDAFFNACYLMLTTENPFEEIPSITESLDLATPFIRSEISKAYEAKATSEIVTICLEVMDVLEDIVEKDMLNHYFHLAELDYEQLEQGLTMDDLKRKPKLANDDVLETDKDGDEDIHDETMPTWHQETSEATKSFLQFDLEQGSKTDLMGEGVREGDDGDQALGMIQGSSQQTSRNDYSKLEAMESRKGEEKSGKDNEFGRENRFAFPVFKDPTPSTYEQVRAYEENKKSISLYQKKLKQMIEKTLEHKKILPRTDLQFGRLNKKLLRLWTDDNPRLFLKKNQPSSKIDAVFSLLVDCSASMFDKMNETKLGITLFHEALKSVQVPHQIVGFWEDTNDATETSQPNYFNTVIDFTSSLKRSSGPEIMQLEPEEDNRDGYAIRHMTKRLLQRSEEQKFLLVFSDGEPAANGYEQNGIIDTHEAVLEARKRGIEVINVFLSNGEIDEAQQKTIQNMYGRYSILVPNIEELPDVLFPLLKKLLHKSI